MNSDLTESVQASIRPGEMVDTYYFGESNLSKQAYPSVVNTRFVQNFTQLGTGSSQFVLSPNGGISDIIAQFVTPASSGQYATLALNQAWGYALISRISVRYGSSAQYFFSGPQCFLECMYDCENRTKCNDMANLGGNAVTGASCGGQSAYVYIKLPHNSPRASGKPLPFPSDLLVQPIVLTIETYALNQVLINQSATPGLNLSQGPATLASAQLQVKQEMLTDSSDLLARRVDMNAHAYTFPLQYFPQQEVQIPVTSDAQNSLQSVNLTGFRAGEVRSILLWLTQNTPGTVDTNPGSGSFNPLYWQQISQVTLTYNGEVFSRFDVGSGALWNLTCDEKSSAYDAKIQTYGSVAQTTPVSYWLECPFSQVNVPFDKEMKLLHGKPILNAVVNLTFQCPAVSTNYVLHACYIYNASLLCSRGSSEYIF